MNALILLGLALSWPLLPFAWLVNAGFDRLRHPFARGLLMLIWPQIGVVLAPAMPMNAVSNTLAISMTALAAFGALFYAWRLLPVRDLFIWARLHATSAWSLLWLAWLAHLPQMELAWLAFGLSLPSAVLTVLAGGLAQRTGGAYVGLGGRLGSRWPRFATVLAGALVVALAAPPLPPFFAMLHLAMASIWPLALLVAVVWLLWTWAVAQLWHAAYFGAAGHSGREGDDLRCATPWFLFIITAALSAAAFAWSWQWLTH